MVLAQQLPKLFDIFNLLSAFALIKMHLVITNWSQSLIHDTKIILIVFYVCCISIYLIIDWITPWWKKCKPLHSLSTFKIQTNCTFVVRMVTCLWGYIKHSNSWLQLSEICIIIHRRVAHTLISFAFKGIMQSRELGSCKSVTKAW